MRAVQTEERIKKSIPKVHAAKEVWGIFPLDWTRSTQELKDEARKGWE